VGGCAGIKDLITNGLFMSQQHNALITGARRGIGRAIAIELAKNGFNIVVNHVRGGAREDLPLKSLKEEIESYGRCMYGVRADISKRNDRVKLVQSAMRHGPIHILVNNAGIPHSKRKDILDIDEENFDEVLHVNLRGTFFLTQLIANKMIQAIKKGDKFKFKIINISSISAYTSSPPRSGYCISKAGISMATKLFADRLAEFGINVYEIRPGIIKTDMTKEVRKKYDILIRSGITPIKRWGQPADVAKAIAAIAQDAFPYSTGEVINIDGGFHLHRL
jgi:NAD(P)-dependent dehydrogenase (short-subunit alcohol dehydrogenase family)